MFDKQDSPAWGFCHECGCELYENDECYLIDGEIYCMDCVDSKRFEMWELRGKL